MASRRLTTVEGEVERAFDWGLRLVGDERVYRFSKFGAPRPEGVAPGDAVRLEVAPGNDGAPTWIKTVAVGAAAPPPITFPPELEAVMADLDAAVGEVAHPTPESFDGGRGDDEAFAGLPVGDPVPRRNGTGTSSAAAPEAPPTGPGAPVLGAEDLLPTDAITELLAQAVDELRALRLLAEAQAQATDALERATVGALSLLGDRLADALKELGVDLVALFGSRRDTTGLPGDGAGANAAALPELEALHADGSGEGGR